MYSKEEWYLDFRKRTIDCMGCGLATKRLCSLPVPGNGNLRARLFIIGEAPGKREAEEGYPFVVDAPAGGDLTQALDSYSQDWCKREDCFLTNSCLCRPVCQSPGRENNTPLPEEIAICKGFLTEQLQAVGPKVILVCGMTAASLIGASPDKDRLGRLRGGVHWYGSIPVVVTWHPSYVERQGGLGTDVGRQFMGDIKVAKELTAALKQPGRSWMETFENVAAEARRWAYDWPEEKP